MTFNKNWIFFSSNPEAMIKTDIPLKTMVTNNGTLLLNTEIRPLRFEQNFIG